MADEVKLTKQQIEEARGAFEMFDKDKDGGICVDELGTVMRNLGQFPSDSELRTMMEETDTDGNGGKSLRVCMHPWADVWRVCCWFVAHHDG